MATQPLQQIVLCHRQSIGATRCPIPGADNAVPTYSEAAGQTWKPGALVKVHTDGTLVVATAGAPLYGQASKAANGSGGTTVGVPGWEISPMEEYWANVYHSTAASAITARTMLMDKFKLINVNGFFHVDIENTTVEDATTADAQVVVIDFEMSDVLSKQAAGTAATAQPLIAKGIGDIYGRVKIRFLQYSLASDGNPNQRMLQGYG